MSVARNTTVTKQTVDALGSTQQHQRKRTYSFSSLSTSPPPTKVQRTSMGSSSLRRQQTMPSEPSSSSSSGSFDREQQRKHAQDRINFFRDRRISRTAERVAAAAAVETFTSPTVSASSSASASASASSSSASPARPRGLQRTTTCASLLVPTPTHQRTRVSSLKPKPSRTLKPLTPPAQIILPSIEHPVPQYTRKRQTSPLAPTPPITTHVPIPSGLIKSKSKPKPLDPAKTPFRMAITACMRRSYLGALVLHCGPRLAMHEERLRAAVRMAQEARRCLDEVTRDLERLVDEDVDMDGDGDVDMELDVDVEDYVMAEMEAPQAQSTSTQPTPARREGVQRSFSAPAIMFSEGKMPMPTLSVSPPNLAKPILTTKSWAQDESGWEFVSHPPLVECAV